MQELNQAIEARTLTGEQWQLWAQSKPLEEFYDTQTDPFEIRNLAGDPQHTRRMSAMWTALEAWIARCDDPLDMPEDELVRTRVYPPAGRQPRTADPEVQLGPTNERGVRLTITCATEGASIGFRVTRPEAVQKVRKDSNEPWRIYDGPTEVQVTEVVEVQAHRIGFRPSTVLRTRVGLAWRRR